MKTVKKHRRSIPLIEVSCDECDHEFEVPQSDVAYAIEEFIDDTEDEEIISWLNDDDLKDEIEGISDVRDFMVEGYERLRLGTITKDEFLEHLFRLAKIDEHNSFEAKNVK